MPQVFHEEEIEREEEVDFLKTNKSIHLINEDEDPEVIHGDDSEFEPNDIPLDDEEEFAAGFSMNLGEEDDFSLQF